MKTKILIFLILLFSIFSCNNEKDFSISERVMIVDSKVDTLFDQIHNRDRPYLRIKFDKEETTWINIYGVSGFEYEDGYIYVLKVEQKIFKNPLPDQPKIIYSLVELKSKIKDLTDSK